MNQPSNPTQSVVHSFLHSTRFGLGWAGACQSLARKIDNRHIAEHFGTAATYHHHLPTAYDSHQVP